MKGRVPHCRIGVVTFQNYVFQLHFSECRLQALRSEDSEAGKKSFTKAGQFQVCTYNGNGATSNDMVASQCLETETCQAYLLQAVNRLKSYNKANHHGKKRINLDVTPQHCSLEDFAANVRLVDVNHPTLQFVLKRFKRQLSMGV